jgi:menaquinone-specific isochorismate synthase
MKLNKISHIRTKLESTIDDKHDVFDIIYQIHPTPAVAGTPKDISIEKISELELHNRGWYAGTLGWINNNLDAHFIVNIRSGIIKENLLNIYAGCGITKNSSPEEEYNESEMKFDYILSKLNNE